METSFSASSSDWRRPWAVRTGSDGMPVGEGPWGR